MRYVMPRRATAIFVAAGMLAALTVAAGAPAAGPRGPVIGGCAVFPADNAWNRDVSRDPVDPRSNAYVRSIDANGNHFLHADFGGGGHYGIPYGVVSRGQPRGAIPFPDHRSRAGRRAH